MNLFRLTVYDTNLENKFETENDMRYEYIGSRNSIWALWYKFKHDLKIEHVEVFNLLGMICQPENGIEGLRGYGI